MTFPVSALYQLFVRSCDLAHVGQQLFTFLCQHTSQLASASLLGACVCLSLFLDGRASECAAVYWPSTGTTELNHSSYTGNALSAQHSSQQFHDDTVSTSVHPLVSDQETNGTTPSCSALGPQLPHGPISSPVLAGPTRNVTGEAMPTSLAEAVTQLSFLEFFQRCNLLIAPLQPSQLPVPISLLDAAMQTTYADV